MQYLKPVLDFWFGYLELDIFKVLKPFDFYVYVLVLVHVSSPSFPVCPNLVSVIGITYVKSCPSRVPVFCLHRFLFSPSLLTSSCLSLSLWASHFLYHFDSGSVSRPHQWWVCSAVCSRCVHSALISSCVHVGSSHGVWLSSRRLFLFGSIVVFGFLFPSHLNEAVILTSFTLWSPHARSHDSTSSLTFFPKENPD